MYHEHHIDTSEDVPVRRVQVGTSVYHPLQLGHPAQNLASWISGSWQHYYLGELVCVMGADTRKTVGQIASVSRDGVKVSCGSGTFKNIPANQVNMFLSKLYGSYYLAEGVCSVPSTACTTGANAQSVKIGGTFVKHLFLGQNSREVPQSNNFPWHCFAKNEAVSADRSDGSKTIGEIREISEREIFVSFGGSEKRFSAAEVPHHLSKLFGSYYIAPTLPSYAQLPASRASLPTQQESRSPQDHTLEDVLKQVDKYLRLQNPATVEKVFRRHASGIGLKKFITKAKLCEALKDLDVTLDSNSVEQFFQSNDMNDDSLLDFEEFTGAVYLPAPVEAWTQSLMLHRLLANALPTPSTSQKDCLRAISILSQDEIGHVVHGFCKGLSDILKERIAELKQGFESMAEIRKPGNVKFAVTKMDNCGNINDFHLGLEGRIGYCNLDFWNGMLAEHCSNDGCNRRFITTNYHIETSPKEEWDIVVTRAPCHRMDHGRKVPDIAQLCKHEIALRAGLSKAEITAVVLYTGPMFQVYNTILRRYPREDYEDIKRYNLFSTTISVIVSAVLKLSRANKLPDGLRLYRGLGGKVDLPESFYKRDANGAKGYVELGFMSTTANREVAYKYSGVLENSPLPLMLEIRVSSVDRGACIKDFSQYEGEVEYLYVPCSFLQQDGPSYIDVTRSGVVEILPVRVNANLKTLTIEEQLQQKKKMHLAAFSYLIGEVRRNLVAIAVEHSESKRAGDFITYTVEQCKDVMARHEAINSKEYSNNYVFQSLILELIDVKNMAIAKLKEWLLSNSSTRTGCHWNAGLRTAHRRWIAHLEASFATTEDSKFATQLCQAHKLIVDSIDEVNELGETRLMAAAADGFAMRNLTLLVSAGAKLNASKSDGETPIWLAAKFGHAQCIESLHLLKANVDQVSNDGASPLYVAAQNGHPGCIKMLGKLKANLDLTDMNGLTAMHQAAINGSVECIKGLNGLGAKLDPKDMNLRTPLHHAVMMNVENSIKVLRDLGANLHAVDNQGKSPSDLALEYGNDNTYRLLMDITQRSIQSVASILSRQHSTRSLIISTGDIGDIDGFLALAEYAKTGSDVLFIMNYPAYIGVSPTQADDKYDENNPGLGYKYSAEDVFANISDPPQKYTEFLNRYNNTDYDANQLMKSAMTDMAFWIATQVWDDVEPRGRGNLMFCIGGVNAVNPFSATAIKNEILVYCDLVPNLGEPLPTKEGAIYGAKGAPHNIEWTNYSKIYIDFNGSLSYWNEAWSQKLSEPTIAMKVKGAFVMGGVQAGSPTCTMPSIPGMLNRFSSATMNQLFHPQRAAQFFAYLKHSRIEVFTVTNNVVSDLLTPDDKDKGRSFVGIQNFLSSNHLAGKNLKVLAEAHYTSKYNPPHKAFDYHTAIAVKAMLHDPGDKRLRSRPRTLLYSNVYGITLVSDRDSWEETREIYIGAADTLILPDDSPQIRAKKINFLREFDIMRSITCMNSLPVFDLMFEMEDGTSALKLAEQH